MLLVSTFVDPEWFDPTVARALPRGEDPYGGLRALEGTEWWGAFARVHPYCWDAAARGHAGPLMRALGSPPRGRASRLPQALSACSQRTSCIMAGPECSVRGVGTRRPPPHCFSPDGLATPEARDAAREIVRCWIEGIPVVVLTEDPDDGRG